jgi:hypothetical protein
MSWDLDTSLPKNQHVTELIKHATLIMQSNRNFSMYKHANFPRDRNFHNKLVVDNKNILIPFVKSLPEQYKKVLTEMRLNDLGVIPEYEAVITQYQKRFGYSTKSFPYYDEIHKGTQIYEVDDFQDGFALRRELAVHLLVYPKEKFEQLMSNPDSQYETDPLEPHTN